MRRDGIVGGKVRGNMCAVLVSLLVIGGLCGVDGTTVLPLSERMWKESSDIAVDVFNTSFVQGLRDGTLDPANFGAYMVQDALYFEEVANILEIAMQNVSLLSGIELKEFFIGNIMNYMRFANELYKSWQISDSSSVELSNGCLSYVDYKKQVAIAMDPMYTVVAMIPCLRLWPWIGQQFQNNSNPGIYNKWVSFNFDPTFDRFKRLDSLVDEWSENGLINDTIAKDVYRNCMRGEFWFFDGAA